jgi:hypothetical protein
LSYFFTVCHVCVCFFHVSRGVCCSFKFSSLLYPDTDCFITFAPFLRRSRPEEQIWVKRCFCRH